MACCHLQGVVREELITAPIKESTLQHPKLKAHKGKTDNFGQQKQSEKSESHSSQQQCSAQNNMKTTGAHFGSGKVTCSKHFVSRKKLLSTLCLVSWWLSITRLGLRPLWGLSLRAPCYSSNTFFWSLQSQVVWG